MKPHDTVMVLNLLYNGQYCDVQGRYLRPAIKNSDTHSFVEVNQTRLSIANERLMQADKYFELLKSGGLPSNASGKLYFLEGDYKSGKN